MAAVEISGLNQRKTGPMKREVCSADIRSVDPMKINPSQIKTGSQYFKNDRILVRTAPALH